ncbi:MAG: bifunctional hydroxymethylpyrimidine kinase/phosphomethylpyrimidine kinase [Oscillospiraceae bacterium]|nr:bifunctional hydroxymethylpyrimidine kinase/phosphomethylpyrimidine kinase [Oscillospiraceae bacterium]
MHSVITIAGSDSSGGAGIQADIKTMTAFGVFATSAVTALTAQNTLGVADIMNVSPAFLGKQLDCVFSDIFPDAVKIGMVPTAELISVIAEKLRFYHAANVVLDPVMISTSGSALMKQDAFNAFRTDLIPLADLLTPNIPEAQVLAEMSIANEADMESAAQKIHRTFRCAVLLKGGHQCNDANDLLCTEDTMQWFRGKRIGNPNTHGTGCTLSSAIASALAKGYSIPDAIAIAKEYISGALSAMLDLGKGSGPMNHMFAIQSQFAENGKETV